MIPDKNQKRTYSIEPYDPEWAVKFKEIKKLLQSVFGAKGLLIEHIGSTSIPGTSAKPLIDVLVVVERMESFEKEKEQMISLGYEWGENYIAPETQIYWKSDGDRKTENIHICVKGSYKANQFIETRDYLRSHPERAKKYGELKKTLKEKFPGDYPAYRTAKQAFLDETERLAREWKSSHINNQRNTKPMNNTTKLIIAIAVSQLAGIIGSVFTSSSIPTWYAGIVKPSFAPPNWLFGPVWITLFALMGIAAFLVWKRGLDRKDVRVALGIFIVQLVLNTFWSIIFFRLQSPGGAFIEIIVLWLAILATIISFGKISKPAAWLLVPYILWVSFAGVLNYFIWMLN